MITVIDINDLFQLLSNHVATCRSAPFLCDTLTSFESWFRVEIIPALWDLGYDTNNIDMDYCYISRLDNQKNNLKQICV
jgi:hypothetical protein